MKPLIVKKYRDYFVINATRIGQARRYGSYKTKAEAQEAAKQLVKDWYKGDYTKSSDVEYDKVTVGQAYEKFLEALDLELESKEIKLATWEQTKVACNWFLKQKISNRLVPTHTCAALFNRFNIREFQNEIVAKIRCDFKALSTREKKKIYIQKFIHYTLYKGWSHVNPLAMDKVSSRLVADAENRDRDHLNATLSDIEKLYKFGLADESFFNKAIFILGVNTGIRQSEIRALRWKNINLNEGYIYINDAVGYRYAINGQTKTKAHHDKGDRKIVIDSEVVDVLKQFKLQSPKCSENDIVFYGKKRDVLSKEYFRDLMERAVRKADTKRLTWGCLRHFYASKMINNLGERWNEVADRMGHKSADFTRSQYEFILENKEKDNRHREAGSTSLVSL